MLNDSLYGFLAAALSFIMTPWVRTMALRWGVTDQPGCRRMHRAGTPLFGGLAVLGSWLGTLGVVLLVDHTPHDTLLSTDGQCFWLLLGVLAIVALGIADDIWDLRPVLKLGVQVAAAAMLLAGEVVITAISDPLTGSAILLGWWSFPLTLIWIIAVTNSFNLIDGLDGLAGGVALIAALAFWGIGMATDQGMVTVLSVLLAGSLAGFLVHNFHPASIFLGDSGSLLLGYVLAALSILIVRQASDKATMLTALLVLGLPLLDMLFAILRRLWRAVRIVRRDPQRRLYHAVWLAPMMILRPDHGHLHHHLLALRLSPRCATLLLYGVSVGLCLSSSSFTRWFGIAVLAVVLGFILMASMQTKRGVVS